ncbi:MAG: septal ring lytic transglycosylase RlpA family protein [Limnohabitans sp.]|nr:septal ring lytic transglycosylase RlpA family protein [Limnohabitans sp.]
MINRFLLGVFTIVASWLTSNFSFTKFEKQSFKSRIEQDTVKKVSIQDTIKKDTVVVDSLSVEEGLYNYKLYKKSGIASYYANKFNGRRTASGERFYNNKFTAAHKRLPFGTKVRVTNLRNGRTVIVKINDRGPHHKKREIDLSRKAFMYLATNKRGGEMRVKIEVAIKK